MLNLFTETLTVTCNEDATVHNESIALDNVVPVVGSFMEDGNLLEMFARVFDLNYYKLYLKAPQPLCILFLPQPLLFPSTCARVLCRVVSPGTCLRLGALTGVMG